MSDERRDIDRNSVRLEPCEIFPHIAHAVATISGDDRRNAVAHEILRFGQLVKIGIRVRMHVDKARRDDEIFGVDLMIRSRIMQIAESSDTVAVNPDIAVKPVISRAIDDLAVANDQVKMCRECSGSDKADEDTKEF